MCVSEQTPFNLVLRCLARLVKEKIITSENDSFGVYFFGTVGASWGPGVILIVDA